MNIRKIKNLIVISILLFSCNQPIDQKNKLTELNSSNNDTSSTVESSVDIGKLRINQNNAIEEIQERMNKYPEFENFSIFNEGKTYYLVGDFFNDGFDDLAFLAKDTASVKLCFIDYGEKENIKILGNKEDPFGIFDYKWALIFEKVEKGSTLWSNYEDGFRSFEETPENEIVILNYDAIYVHAFEECGGGFIFWKDKKFNWLQQE